MVQFDGLRPARLKVGIISAGRVGTALGVALERADHVVVACSAISHASRQRAQRRLPDTPVVAAGGSRQRTRRPGLRFGGDGGGAGRDHRGPHLGRQRGGHPRAADPAGLHPAGDPPGDDVHRLRRGHQPAAGHLLRHHGGRRGRLRDRPVTGAGDGRGAVQRRRGRPRALPRRAGAREQPPRDGAVRRARGVAGRAARQRTARPADRRRAARRHRRTHRRAAGHLAALHRVAPELAQAYRVNALRTAQRAHAPQEVVEVLAP